MVVLKSRRLSDTQRWPCLPHQVSMRGVYKAACTQEMWPFKHIPENALVIDAVSHEIFLLFKFFWFFAHPPSPLPLFPSLHSLSLFITLSLGLAAVPLAGRSSTSERQPSHQDGTWMLWEGVGGPSQPGPPCPAAAVAPSQVPLSRTGQLGSPGLRHGREKQFQADFQKAKCSDLPANRCHKHKYPVY